MLRAVAHHSHLLGDVAVDRKRVLGFFVLHEANNSTF